MVDSQQRRVTVIPGDGIGPEVVRAGRDIIEAAGVPILWEEHEAGASVFKKGLPTGVPQDTIDSITRTRVVLKGPLETPVGYGEKSANVTLRKLFETFGNIRPVREMPGVTTPYSGRGIDLVVVRENVEDLYAGIEHQQSPGVAQAIKLITRKGCEKIVRLGFELARAEGRKKVHCATKANILKLTEGLLKRTFEAIAPEYPDLEASHIIVDNCAHQLVKAPQQFDVIITTNMNGDILSDLTSALVGGLGYAPSANLGTEVAIFEAVHGSAPKYAGKNVINPTALIQSAVMMLRFLGYFEAAASIEHALLVTLEQGTLTRDVVGDAKGTPTTVYTEAIIKNLGKKSSRWQVRDYQPIKMPRLDPRQDFVQAKTRRVTGVDLFVESALPPGELGPNLQKLTEGFPLQLKLISNRGTKVFPTTGAITDCIDVNRCRFMPTDSGLEITDALVIDLIQRVAAKHHWMHVEKLQEFDGSPGYTKSQGED